MKRIEKALRAGKTVEISSEGYRKGQFYDFKCERETLRIECLSVKGGKALVKLGRQEKDIYLKAGYSRSNYTTFPAEGIRDAGVVPPKEFVDQLAKEARLTGMGTKATDQMADLEVERRRLNALLDTSKEIARQRGINIRADVRIVEKRIEAIDRKLGLREAA